MGVKVDSERFKGDAEALVAKIKGLIREGNVRRIIIKDEAGNTVVEIPVTIGVVGAIMAPLLAAVAAIGAIAGRWTIEVERREDSAPADPPAAGEAAVATPDPGEAAVAIPDPGLDPAPEPGTEPQP